MARNYTRAREGESILRFRFGELKMDKNRIAMRNISIRETHVYAHRRV